MFFSFTFSVLDSSCGVGMLDQEPSETWAVVDLTKGYPLLGTGSVLFRVPGSEVAVVCNEAVFEKMPSKGC